MHHDLLNGGTYTVLWKESSSNPQVLTARSTIDTGLISV